jgi:hypothetical protein
VVVVTAGLHRRTTTLPISGQRLKRFSAGRRRWIAIRRALFSRAQRKKTFTTKLTKPTKQTTKTAALFRPMERVWQ